MATRRLVAIMFTDIVGYTAVMQADEQRGVEIRERHRDLTQSLVRRFDGEWLSENGDETLSIFPSVLDAVNCALELSEALAHDPDLKLRIGIHLGDVVFDEGHVYGDGVNLAARIRPLAEPGEVCVSEEVYESIRNQGGLRMRSLGRQSLKNVERQVEVFRVDRDNGEPSRAARDSTTANARRFLSARTAAATLMVALAAGVGLYLATRAGSVSSTPAVAVLPFADMSPGQDQGFLCDGMAEEIIHVLSGIGGLRVAARTSSFQFKGKDLDVRKIGSGLEVDAVLEGSIQRSAGRLQVTVQMIDVESGFHLWSKKYQRRLEDIFVIQDEIAISVADAVGAEGATVARADSADDQIRSRSAPPPKPAHPNLEAYLLFLRGRFELHAGTPQHLASAVEHLESALKLDPGYSRAREALEEARIALAEVDSPSPYTR
jgi:TolB-like protein/class 3 adenylate cyclase